MISTSKYNVSTLELGLGYRYGSINKMGEIHYELSNHLGNVLNVITDRKIAIPTADLTKVDHYTSQVVSYSDYFPFGMQMPGRHGETENYRYGYQGSEKDDEVKGQGNSYTTQFRQLDPRVGRWLTIDPVTQPWQSSYTSMDNNPIWFNDPFGDIVKVEGNKKFQRQTNRAIKRLKKTDEGLRLYNKLNNDEAVHTIRKHSENKTKVGQEGNPDDMNDWQIGDIGFTGDTYSKKQYFGKGGWLSLGHEMRHTSDLLDGEISNEQVQTPDNTFQISRQVSDGNGGAMMIDETLDVSPIDMDEVRAVHSENLMRAQSNIKLRTHYSILGVGHYDSEGMKHIVNYKHQRLVNDDGSSVFIKEKYTFNPTEGERGKLYYPQARETIDVPFQY